MQRFRAGLFLMELTISIFFFSIAAAVCLQIFAKAHSLNVESEALSRAHVIATNIADEYISGQFDYTQKHLDYNENLEPATGSSYYSVDLVFDSGTLDITVSTPSGDAKDYTLQVFKYIPAEVTQ